MRSKICQIYDLGLSMFILEKARMTLSLLKNISIPRAYSLKISTAKMFALWLESLTARYYMTKHLNIFQQKRPKGLSLLIACRLVRIPCTSKSIQKTKLQNKMKQIIAQHEHL